MPLNVAEAVVDDVCHVALSEDDPKLSNNAVGVLIEMEDANHLVHLAAHQAADAARLSIGAVAWPLN